MTTKAFVGTVGGGVKALSVDQFFDYLEQQGETNTPRDLFSRVAWLFRAIELRANAMGGLPYAVYDRGSEDEFDWDDQYPRLHRLLRMIEADLCLSGAAYVLKKRIFAGSEREEIADLQRLNPWTMKVLTEPHSRHGLTEDVEGVYGFQQTVKDETRWFEPGQMLYFDHLYNPTDDLGPGVAPAQVCGIPAELVANMNQYASAFFERGAIIPFVLKTDSTVPESEQERLRGVFKRLYQGVSNFFKTPLLQRGLDIQQLGTAPTDLAMPDLEDSAKKQVAAALGIPPGLLEQQDASHATAKAHQLSFYTETVIPEAMMVEERLNDDLMDMMGLELRFKPEELEVIQQQEAEKASSVAVILSEMRQSATSGLLEKWEARHYLDVLMRQMQMPSLDDIEMPEDWEEEEQQPPPFPPQMPPQFQQQGDEGEVEDEEEASKKVPSPARGSLHIDYSGDLGKWKRMATTRFEEGNPEKALAFETELIPANLADGIRHALGHCENADDVADLFDQVFSLKAEEFEDDPQDREKREHEDRLQTDLLNVWREFVRPLVDLAREEVRPEDKSIATLIGAGLWADLARRLTRILLPRIETMMMSAADDALARLPYDIGIDETALMAEVSDWAREHTEELVEGVNDTTKDAIRAKVENWAATGGTEAELEQAIAEVMTSEYRARRIAITEATAAFALARMNVWRRSPVIKKHRWQTANDDLVCPICKPVNQKVVKIGDNFPGIGKDSPPAHPNCRCWTTPVPD